MAVKSGMPEISRSHLAGGCRVPARVRARQKFITGPRFLSRPPWHKQHAIKLVGHDGKILIHELPDSRRRHAVGFQEPPIHEVSCGLHPVELASNPADLRRPLQYVPHLADFGICFLRLAWQSAGHDGTTLCNRDHSRINFGSSAARVPHGCRVGRCSNRNQRTT